MPYPRLGVVALTDQDLSYQTGEDPSPDSSGIALVPTTQATYFPDPTVSPAVPVLVQPVTVGPLDVPVTLPDLFAVAAAPTTAGLPWWVVAGLVAAGALALRKSRGGKDWP